MFRRVSHRLAARSPHFATVTPGVVSDLSGLLGSGSSSAAGRVVTAEEELTKYNKDWLGHYEGKSQVVVRVQNTEEISKVLAYCNEHALAVCPQAGNTDLVGGSVPVHDEIIISTSLMNKIPSVDKDAMVLDCDCGVILQTAQEAALQENLVMPIDLGAKGSCQVGGNVATNAGGLNVVRYGTTRQNVLGLEAVLADGSVLNSQSKLRKDNTGYDVKQLMIGSEGTLGIISRLQIRLHPLPREGESTLLVKLRSIADAQEFFSEVQRNLSEVLGAFELMDHESLTSTKTETPFNANFNNGEVIVLMQTLGGTEDSNMERLNQILKNLRVKEEDHVIATSTSAMKEMWRIREELPIKLGKLGRIYKFDLSSPINKFYDVMWYARELLQEHPTNENLARDIVTAGYGHFGDGNIHLNFVDVSKQHHDDMLRVVDAIYQYCNATGEMSFSAEHGVGLSKLPQMKQAKGEGTVENRLMKLIKSSFDPKGIMNPYKVLP